MAYPIVTDASARLWWKTWKESGRLDEPPEAPEADTSAEGRDLDWSAIIAQLMDALSALYDRVDGKGHADRSGVLSRLPKAFQRQAGAKAKALTSDRYEAEACVEVHKALPRDAALADPEFWIWMATGPGSDLIRRRYPPRLKKEPDGVETWAIADIKNFTQANARETFFYRLWVRAELAYDPTLDDPYELARYGDIDFWRSHVFRQMSTEAGPLLAAFIRFQHPEGLDGDKRLSQEEIRELIKYMKRAAANVLVETLDEQGAEGFVEEQWQKIQALRSQTTTAE